MDRRQFLIRSGLGLASAAGAGCGRTDGGAAALLRSADDDSAWARVREQFAISDDYIHMSALYIASHPRPVREAIDRHRRELDANPVVYLNENNRRLVREAVSEAARHLGAPVESDIAITDSTTMGIGLVYNGLRLSPGDEVLTTQHDYYATHEALRLAAERKGIVVRQVALYEDVTRASEAELVERLMSGVSPRTRALALTWVHSGTGLKLPVARIAEALQRINASRDEDDRILLCVDGVHGFGVEDVTVTDLGCDFFMAGCHKWLFGPRGTGIVWGSPAGWRRCLATVPSFLDESTRGAWLEGAEVSGRTDGPRMSPGGFKPFEHQWAMAEAFRFCQDIGKTRIAARTHGLATRLKEGLARMGHVSLRTPASEALSAGIVCFELDGMDPWKVVDQLRGRRIVATVTPYAERYVRLAPSIRNSMGEVDLVLEEIHALA